MFLDGLDETDRQILCLLLDNGRMSYSEIGEKVHLSRVAVKSRIQALEKSGILEEYTIILNPQKISGSISCYFDLETEPNAFPSLCTLFEQAEAVTQLYHITGNCRLHMHAVFASQGEMESFLQWLHGVEGIRKLEENFILARIKDVKGLRL